jgi:hypothetical protein
MLAAAWGCRVLEIKIRTEAAQRAESQRMRDFDAMAPISQRNYVRLVAADQSRRDVTEPPGRRPQP